MRRLLIRFCLWRALRLAAAAERWAARAVKIEEGER